MNPKYFKEAHVNLAKPHNMTDEECGSLWVHRTERGECISLWKIPFWKRVKLLFHGHVWLGVLSGHSQPPVWLDCQKTIFKNTKSQEQ